MALTPLLSLPQLLLTLHTKWEHCFSLAILVGLRTVPSVFLLPDPNSSLLLQIIHVKLVVYLSIAVRRANGIQIVLNRLFHESSLETETAVLVFCISPGK